MARIRTIKPEFWDSPSTARASAVARLAFIAMWNWADDFGRGTANPKELEGFIFPNDDVRTLSGGTSENFRDVLAEVSECFGVEFYTVDGRPFYAIPTWQKHQRNERSAKPKYPGPADADLPADQRSNGTSANIRRAPAEAPTTSGPGTGEQGNRGTGEQRETRKRAASLPDDWQPTQAHIDRATQDGVDLTREADKFRAWVEANDVKSKSWNGRFTQWLIQAAEYQQQRNGGRPASQAREEAEDLWARLRERPA